MLGLREQRPYTVLMSYEEERDRERDREREGERQISSCLMHIIVKKESFGKERERERDEHARGTASAGANR
jgi:hypothetical protein